MNLTDLAIISSITILAPDAVDERFPYFDDDEREEMIQALSDHLWDYKAAWLCPEDSTCPDFNEETGCTAKHYEPVIEAFFG